jgi:hypothetical protein
MMSDDRISAKYGRVTIGSSSTREQSGWYVWPAEISSLEAAMAGCLLGPFDNEIHAKKISEDCWFEKERE